MTPIYLAVEYFSLFPYCLIFISCSFLYSVARRSIFPLRSWKVSLSLLCFLHLLRYKFSLCSSRSLFHVISVPSSDICGEGGGLKRRCERAKGADPTQVWREESYETQDDRRKSEGQMKGQTDRETRYRMRIPGEDEQMHGQIVTRAYRQANRQKSKEAG